MRNCILLILTMLVPQLSFAAQQERTVQYIETTASSGAVFFHMHSTEGWSGDHECSSGGTGIHWVIQNPDTEIGKNQLSMLMMAAASEKTITVASTGDECVPGIAGGKGFKVEVLKVKL
jgi:hypothetical protein